MNLQHLLGLLIVVFVLVSFVGLWPF